MSHKSENVYQYVIVCMCMYMCVCMCDARDTYKNTIILWMKP